MGAIMNGMALHGGIIPYGGTFLIFSRLHAAVDPARGVHAAARDLRLHARLHRTRRGWADAPADRAAVGAARDSGFTVIRPADANETAEAWRVGDQAREWSGRARADAAEARLHRPHEYGAADGVREGRVRARRCDRWSAAGRAHVERVGSRRSSWRRSRQLAAEGIRARVVSMPSMELFAAAGRSVPRLGAAGGRAARRDRGRAPMSWYQWVGTDGVAIGLDHFGASAPYRDVLQGVQLTPEKSSRLCARWWAVADLRASGPALVPCRARRRSTSASFSRPIRPCGPVTRRSAASGTGAWPEATA